MSLYGPTFHVIPFVLCIIFQCNLHISCIMSCGNKIVKLFQNCFKLFHMHHYICLPLWEIYLYIKCTKGVDAANTPRQNGNTREIRCIIAPNHGPRTKWTRVVSIDPVEWKQYL